MRKVFSVVVATLLLCEACGVMAEDVKYIIDNRQRLNGERVSFKGYFCMETGMPSIFTDFMACKNSLPNLGFELILPETVAKRHELYGSGGNVEAVGILHATPENIAYTDKFFQLGYVVVDEIKIIESVPNDNGDYVVSSDKDKNAYMKNFLVSLRGLAQEKDIKKIEGFLELGADRFYDLDRESTYSRIKWFFYESQFSLANLSLDSYEFYFTRGRFDQYWVCATDSSYARVAGLVRLGVSSMLRGEGKLCLSFVENEGSNDLLFVPLQIMTN